MAPLRCKDITQLMRMRLSLMVALASVTGYILQKPIIDTEMFLPALVAFLLSAACSVFNQMQERRPDAIMRRTSSRPLASGRVSLQKALALGGCLLAAASVIVAGCGSWPVFSVFALVLFLYNGLYTYAKSKTPLALFAGAAAGALPPVLGWVFAGGSLSHPVVLLFFSLFFVWQIPHFWLLAERHREDYEKAGFFVPAQYISKRIYPVILRLWISAFALLILAPVGTGMVVTGQGRLCIAATAVVVLTAIFLRRRLHLYHALNGCMASICFIFIMERIYG